MTDLTNHTLKSYQFRAKLGEGGFGAVYQAYQAVVERDVAIKAILPEYANRPEFIRRFEAEAQLVARLEHLHIVPLYDYWREPDGAFLVMRWLQGGSLRRKVNNKPMDPLSIAHLLDQVASALLVAHRRKVIHRDIKPDNILLDEEGNAYLADFGIAKDISVSSDEGEHIVGSPAYLSPEQVLGSPLTPATDIYSLGVMLYELLTGHAPFHSTSAHELLTKHVMEALPAAREVLPTLPPGVDDVIQKATHKTPAERYQDAISLATAFRKALSPINGPASADQPNLASAEALEPALEHPTLKVTKLDPARTYHPASTGEITFKSGEMPILAPENPYKGLRAFQEADADDFFGREAEVEQLVRRLADADDPSARFLAVIGSSGSGKSSVVRAGLVPALRRGALTNSDRWFVSDMIPGSRPFEALESALLQVATFAPPNLAQALASDDQGLSRMIERILPADPQTELVLVIDQFEEIFALVDQEQERARLLNNLLEAVTAPNSRLRLVITLRADFYDRPLAYPEFGALVRKRTEVVLPLSGDALKQAILRPAERAGIRLEPGLVEAIVGDLAEQPGALPLVEYALTELYERREGLQLTLGAYRGTGGVLGALARRADEIYHGLDTASREAARQMFLRMVALGDGSEDTRRRVYLTDLPTIGGDSRLMSNVIDTFARYRLLTLDRDPATRSPTVEVAHEALIRTWEPLRTWIKASREDLQLQQRLSAAASEWVSMNRDSGFLASGTRLDQFEGWAKETSLALNHQEQAFLDQSTSERAARRAADEARKAREARNARRAQYFGVAAAVLAVVGILAVIATGNAINQSNEARQQVFIAGETLTPVPVTLAAAAFTQGKAQQDAQDAQAKVVAANQTLTPVAQQLQVQLRNVNALNLASDAVRELGRDNGNPEVASLLAIRSLNTNYESMADTLLMRALDFVFVLRMLPQPDYATSVAYSPDGKLAVTGSVSKSAYLWDLSTGKQLRSFDGHTDAVIHVRFSPDGKSVLTAGKDHTARLWDVSTGRELQRFVGHTDAVRDVAFAPDGKTILTGSADGTAGLWDAQTGTEIRQFVGHTAAIYSVAFAPDGKSVLTGSLDGTARLWDVQTGSEIHEFKGHTSYVMSVAFSPDGSRVLTGGVDATARLWDAQSGNALRVFSGHADAVDAVTFSPNGKQVLTGSYDFSARVWDVDSGAELRRLTGHTDLVADVAWSPDGSTVLTASRDHSLRLWSVLDDINSRLTRQLLGHTAAVSFAAYTNNGKTILTTGYDGTIRIWDATTYRQVGSVPTESSDSITTAAIAGNQLLTGSAGRTAILWDLASGKQLQKFGGHANYLIRVALSADGKTVFSASQEAAHLWDAVTGKELSQPQIASTFVIGAAFSPDGKSLVTGHTDGIARLWDVATGQMLREYKGHDNAIETVAFAPDGKTFVTGGVDRTVRLWDLASGKQIRQFVGHSGLVYAVVFSADGKTILTASDDHSARLWDVAMGAELRQFVGHTAAVLNVAFAPDGKSILTASSDASARLWDIDYRDFIHFACGRLPRDLTDIERLKFSIQDTSPTCP